MRRTPQGTTKPKRRSTSRKRSAHLQSTVKPVEDDDDLLVKALNERANSDREVLVSKDHYEELKQAKKTLKLTSAQLASANKELAEMQLELKAQQAENARLQKEMKTSLDKRKGDSQEVKELTYANSQLSKQLEDARASAQEQHRSHQSILSKLRSSLSDIEKVVSSRASVATRHIGRCQSVLSQVSSALTRDVPKPQVARMVTEAAQQLAQVLTVLTSSDTVGDLGEAQNGHVEELQEENAKLKEDLQRMQSNEDLLEQYRAAIDKMREQIQLLRDRVKELEGSEDFKRQLEDRDARILLLSKEKDMLNEHVKTLQATLNEQRAVIENLRGIITKVNTDREEPRVAAASPRGERRRTPSITDFPKAVKVESAQPVEDLDSRIERVYIGESNELNIQAEIASLDQEIFQLQSSLQRALDNP